MDTKSRNTFATPDPRACPFRTRRQETRASRLWPSSRNLWDRQHRNRNPYFRWTCSTNEDRRSILDDLCCYVVFQRNEIVEFILAGAAVLSWAEHQNAEVTHRRMTSDGSILAYSQVDKDRRRFTVDAEGVKVPVIAHASLTIVRRAIGSPASPRQRTALRQAHPHGCRDSALHCAWTRLKGQGAAMCRGRMSL